MRSDRSAPVWLALVCGTAFAAFLPAARGPFIFDDVPSIVANPTIRSLWPPSVPLHPPRLVTVSGRPVANFTLAINYAINRWLGVDPVLPLGYHVFNVLLHIACGCVLFAIVRRTLYQQQFDDGWRRAADWGALAVSAMWMLHPLQTDAVAYTVQRTELLVSVFYLATLYAAIRSGDTSRPRMRLAWRSAAVIACLLGMGSKEVMITAPLMVVLYDRVFRASTWRDLLRNGQPLFYGALVATCSWAILLALEVPRADTAGFQSGVPWYLYSYSQAWAIAHYLRLFVGPSGFSVDYGPRPITDWRAAAGLVVLTPAVVGTIAAWRRVDRWGWAAFLGAWFFLLLAPSSSFVPVSTEIAAERRMYLASAAVVTLLVVAAEWIRRRLVARYEALLELRTIVPVGGVIAALCALAAITAGRSWVYADPVRLWRDATHAAPLNPRAYVALGDVLLRREAAFEHEATELFQRATRIDSTFAPAWFALGVQAHRRGNRTEAESLYSRALRLRPEYADATRELAKLYVAEGKHAQAVPLWRRLSEIAPSDHSFVDLGLAQANAGELSDAVYSLRTALTFAPDRSEVAAYLGGLLVQLGRATEARIPLERAVELGGATPLTLALLTRSYAESGDTTLAITTAGRASAGNAADPRIGLMIGSAMFRIERASLAQDYIDAVVREHSNEPNILTAAAHVEAEAGRYAEATGLLRKALALDPAFTPAREALAQTMKR